MNDYDYRSYRILNKLRVVPLVKAALIAKDSGIKGINSKIKSRKEWKKAANIDTLIYKDISFPNGTIDIVIDEKYDISEIQNMLEKLDIKYNLFYINNNPTKKDNYKEITTTFFKQYFLYRSFIFISDNKKIIENFYNCIIVKKNEQIVNKIKDLLNNIETLKLLANYNNANNITVKASTFLDYKGTNYYSGGAERYLVDLHEVCKKMGYNLDIYQNADIPYFRKFNNINVIGMATKKVPLNYSMEYIKEQAKNYTCATRYFSQLHIYSAFFECYPYCIGPSIGISHGVAWDSPMCKKTNGEDFWLRNERMIESAAMCDKMVSVDTNTANWFQTVDYELGNQRVKVIPNYVDTNEFYPNKTKENNDKIVITYPRRLYEPRGMYLLLDIIDDLFKKYPNIEIHFVGKGFDEDVQNIKNKIAKYPDRIFCYSQTPDRMHEVYKKSDISLVPTLYSEGTSLSCLEAMATENIVISTRIGGLTDLIINGYNGYLIEPTKESLLKTLESVLDNYDKQEIIKKRARETAEVFNKNRWSQSWTEIIKDFDLKEKSENIDLVEFYVKDVTKMSKKTFELVKKELLKNQLIYIRSKKEITEDKISGGLIQVVSWNEEIVSTAKKIYVEKSLEDKIDRPEKIELI